MSGKKIERKCKSKMMLFTEDDKSPILKYICITCGAIVSIRNGDPIPTYCGTIKAPASNQHMPDEEL